MPLVLSDAGIEMRLTAIAADFGAALKLCLFTTNIIPAKTDVAGDYTPSEATFTGYGRITIASWGTPATVANVCKTVGPLCVFTRSGGAVEDVYGYFVLDAGNVLLWAESFPGGPVAMASIGQTLGIIPVMTDESVYG